MLTLYTWGTPNGRRVSILLAELGLAHHVQPINILTGEQNTPAFRAINPNGKIAYQVVQDLGVGRSVDETLRVLEAFQYVEKHGEVCPAGWKKGSKAMKASPAGVAEYLAENAEGL